MEGYHQRNLVGGHFVGTKGAGRILPSIRVSTSNVHQGQQQLQHPVGRQVINLVSQPSHHTSRLRNLNGNKDHEGLVTNEQPASRTQRRVSSGGSGQKFVVVAQGKNWLRIRPYSEVDNSDADDDDDEEEDDVDDETNSTSDSLHSMRIGQKSSNRVGGVLVRSTKITAGHGAAQPLQSSNGMRGQDSGFSTDGKVSGHLHSASSSSEIHHQWSKEEDHHHHHHHQSYLHGRNQRHSTRSSCDDELAAILDQIGHKSWVLRAQLEKTAVTPSHPGHISLSDIGLDTDQVLAELERLRAERDQLQERLASDRLIHGREVGRLHEELVERENTKRLTEERMEVLVAEREKLISNIHCMHSQFSGRTAGGQAHLHQSTTAATRRVVSRRPVAAAADTKETRKPRSGQSMIHHRAFNLDGPTSLTDMLDNKKKLPVHLNRSRVTAILTERNPLELQRQLLSSTVEQALSWARQKRTAAEWQTRAETWKRTELSLRAEAEVARQSNVQLQVMVHQMEMDLDAERSKRQVLERALHSAYKDLTAQQQQKQLPMCADEVVVHRPPTFEATAPPASTFTNWKDTTNEFKVREQHSFYGQELLKVQQHHQQLGAGRACEDSEGSEEDGDYTRSSTPLMDTMKHVTVNDGLEEASSVMAAHPMTRSSSSRPPMLVDIHHRPPTKPAKGYIAVAPCSRYGSSQSAEDVRDVDWEWTYDVTRTRPIHQTTSRTSYVAIPSLMMQHQRRTVSEART